MPTVITYWQTPEDEVAFLEYLGKTGDVDVYPFGKQGTKEELAPRSLADYAVERNREPALITPRRFREAIILSPCTEEGNDIFWCLPCNPKSSDTIR